MGAFARPVKGEAPAGRAGARAEVDASLFSEREVPVVAASKGDGAITGEDASPAPPSIQARLAWRHQGAEPIDGPPLVGVPTMGDGRVSKAPPKDGLDGPLLRPPVAPRRVDARGPMALGRAHGGRPSKGARQAGPPLGAAAPLTKACPMAAGVIALVVGVRVSKKPTRPVAPGQRPVIALVPGAAAA